MIGTVIECNEKVELWKKPLVWNSIPRRINRLARRPLIRKKYYEKTHFSLPTKKILWINRSYRAVSVNVLLRWNFCALPAISFFIRWKFSLHSILIGEVQVKGRGERTKKSENLFVIWWDRIQLLGISCKISLGFVWFVHRRVFMVQNIYSFSFFFRELTSNWGKQ